MGKDPTLVPPTKIPPRAPFGPSVVLMAGIPFSGMAFVLQKSAAVSKETWEVSRGSSKRSTGQQTFSFKLRFANFSLAAKRVFLSNLLFCCGLHGGEYSVSGVEGVFESFILKEEITTLSYKSLSTKCLS